MAEVFTKSISDYFPMQNVKSIDYQSVKWRVVQMWFKLTGIIFHVVATKTDLELLK